MFGQKKYQKNNQSKIIDLKDVTGTGSGSYRQSHLLNKAIVFSVLFVLKIICFITLGSTLGRDTSPEEEHLGMGICLVALVLFFLTLIYLLSYLTSELHMLTFQYSGSETAFNMAGIAEEEIDFFQRQLRLAKDNAAENNIEKSMRKETASSVVQSAPYNSKTDELFKLAELLSKGVISQEEFEKMKRELI